MNDQVTPQVFSIGEFCLRNKMCMATFYKMKKQGRGPRCMAYGGTQRISLAAERDWQRAREKDADSAAAKLEQARRSELASRAGKAAIASPKHVRNADHPKMKARAAKVSA